MKQILSFLLMLSLTLAAVACGDNESEPTVPGNENEGNDSIEAPEGSRVLVAYFSWGGTTRSMAEQIARQTGGTLFEIVPVTPYPTDYNACTDVALRERDNNERPAIKDKVGDMADYDVVFIGCPVWWHTAPMIISTFAESYDFSDKTVVAFCTYASTYRDETLQKIVDLTPESNHLAGLGLTGSAVRNTANVTDWLRNIKMLKD